jgi:hypothetical protein
MQRRTKRFVGAIALIAVLAAGGAAYTASNTLPTTDTAGYGNISVTGADVSDIQNVLSTDGQNITQVNLTFATAIPSNATVTAGFGPTAGTPPTTLPITCTVAANFLSAACGTGSTNLVATSAAGEFAVAVDH